MTSSTSPRSRSRLAGIAVLASAVAASSLTPLLSSAATAATLPASPAVVGPTDAGPQLKEVVLDWAPVPGAASYVVQVGTDDEWSDEPTLELTSVATRLTLPASLPHASYVWRVAGLGKDGQGRWSRSGTFTRGWTARATPVSPAAGSAVGTAAGVPTFRWTPVPTASEYQLQVSTSPYFDAPFRTQAGVRTESCFTTRTSITPFNSQATARNDGAGDCVFSLLGTGEQRWWRVRPLDHVVDDAQEVDTTPVVDEGISSQPPASAEQLDTTACPSAPAPMGSAAPVGSGTSPTPSPSASATPTDAASPSASPSASPTAAPVTEGGCEPAHTVEKGAWSAGVAFTHRMAFGTAPYYDDLVTPERPMPTPTASSDVCASTGPCRDFPTVSWASVPGAQWYRLYVALDADLTNIHEIVETPGLSWTPTAQWRDSTAGGAYRVVVQPCTVEPAADGRGPGCDEPSAPLQVRKSSPKLAPAAPADGAALGREVLLRWQSASSALAAATGSPATSEAYAYRVQVSPATNPDFHTAGLADDETVDATHHVSAKKAYPNGAYLWRVQAVDASGHKLPWSAVRRFTVDSTAPTFHTVPATGLAVDGSLRVVFSERVRGISAATVGLRSTPVVLTPAADGRSVTLKPRARLLPGATYSVHVGPQVTDLAGNPVATGATSVRANPLVDDRSPALTLNAGAWSRLSASNAVGRTYTRSVPTAARPSVASVAVFGRGVQVKGCVGPANGVLEVWADGARVARVDTYRAYSACGVVLATPVLKGGLGLHRVQLRGVGAKSARSKGTAVAVDVVTAF